MRKVEIISNSTPKYFENQVNEFLSSDKFIKNLVGKDYDIQYQTSECQGELEYSAMIIYKVLN